MHTDNMSASPQNHWLQSIGGPTFLFVLQRWLQSLIQMNFHNFTIIRHLHSLNHHFHANNKCIPFLKIMLSCIIVDYCCFCSSLSPYHYLITLMLLTLKALVLKTFIHIQISEARSFDYHNTCKNINQTSLVIWKSC